MRTQSPDTHPEAERVQIALMRGFSPARKFRLVCEMSDWLAFRDPDNLPESLHTIYGSLWADRFARYQQCHPEISIQGRDLRGTIQMMAHQLNHRRVSFAITGRIACSFYGLPSTTHEIELVINTQRHFIFMPGFVRHRTSYFDISRLIRIDMRYEPLWLARARAICLIEGEPPIALAQPEDTTIDLLDRFHNTGRCDDGLYNDILSMVKVQAPYLDYAALFQRSCYHDLLDQLLEDAGVQL